MDKIKTAAFGGAGLALASIFGEYALARYFVRRTLCRAKATNARTKKLAGTDWEQYIPVIQKDKEHLLELPHQDLYIRSFDGLKLHGTFFPAPVSENELEEPKPKRVVICFHGYTSSGLKDYTSLACFYHELGFSLLLADARAHGESEGKYIGFGCLDRYDARLWTKEMLRFLGQDCEIVLQGISMGAATVLMAAGLLLPQQVKAVVSDCAFTSAWDVFASVLKHTYHLPPLPLLAIADKIAKKEAGYGLNECNALEEVKKIKVPVLFIHGEADTFVPLAMGKALYAACRAPYKAWLSVPGAGHAESFYKDTAGYEAAVKKLLLEANVLPEKAERKSNR